MRFLINALVLAGILIFSFSTAATPDSTGSVNGYSLEDKNNNGITDSFEQPQGSPADSVNQGLTAGQAGEVRKREGHRNNHGEHGKELDRGSSPHAH